ncbi:MAG TPA: hypothetical protein VNJ07_12400 [Chitinophagales bacterium]|nr:hypothetical protein [Chitinophagales bacterium]
MIYLLFGLAFLPTSAFSQGTQTTFGQNRVQYKHFEWSYYETDKFVTYFYLGGQDIGKFVIQFAEKEVSRVEELLEYKINKRIEILVYNDLSDLNQTNIGQQLELPNPGGLTKVIENKMFVYFDGNHQHLEKQIRQGIAQIFINHIVFGGNLQEILQNAVLLNLPAWFTDGLAEYVGVDWNTELDNKLRDGILTGKYRKFNKLTGEEAKFAGHALWHYVEEKYGKSAVPNLLYLTRINRSVESGFLFVLGGSVKSVLAEWYDYYYNHYMQEKNSRSLPVDTNHIPVRRQKKYPLYEVKLSADGRHFAYAANNSGRYKVRLHDFKTGKSKRVMKGGMKTITLVTDYHYPLMAWSPDGKTLAVIYEKRDNLFLLLYNIDTGDKMKQPITKFQQIHSFAFTDDPRLLVMSASNRGQSDIYTYYIPTTLVEQLTNDYYDDIETGFVKIGNRRGIIFLSNRLTSELNEQRLDTILPGNNFDLYFYNLGTRSNELVKVTSTPFYSESQPLQLNDSLFAFLSDDSGIRNRYAGYFESIFSGYDTVYYFQDSIVANPVWKLDSLSEKARAKLDSVRVLEVYKDTAHTFPITDFFTNIIEHDISGKARKSVDMHLLNSKFEFFVTDLNDSSFNKTSLENTFYQNFRQGQINRQKLLEKEREGVQLRLDRGELSDTLKEQEELFFQSDFNTSPEINVAEYLDYEEAEESQPVFKLTRVRPYRVRFSTDYVVTQFLDNGIIMTQYQKFTPGVPVYTSPPLSMTINLGISDLFEDYRITGGFRFPYDFNGSEDFIAFENLKKKVDKKLLYYRKVDRQIFNDVVPFTNTPIFAPPDNTVESKIKTNYFEYRMNFPFDVIKSIRWYLAFRHDNYIFLSKEDFSHNLPSHAESWLFTKAEYVHDNTVSIGLNLLNGIRFKIFMELHKQIPFENKTIFNNLDLKLPGLNDAYLAVFGFDFRYYQKVHKNIVWANRIAWSSSIGTQKLIYYLGGVDSWIAPEFDRSTPISENNNYAFQALATNLRGFKQNVRNGNSFVVFNSELRIPVFAYLSNTTIKSEFIRNFQVLGFTDIGTAWEGFNPWNKENPLFTDVIGRDPVTVTVEYFKNPIVFGYGVGMRTSLFGYFVRLDIAWGNDSGIKTESPRFYFSFSTDF